MINAYTIAFGGALLLGGRAADLFGRRRIFVVGLLLFTVGSPAGGLASPRVLLGARIAQGLGGALLLAGHASPSSRRCSRRAGAQPALASGAPSPAPAAPPARCSEGCSPTWLELAVVFFINLPVGRLRRASRRASVIERRAPKRPSQLDLGGARAPTGGLVRPSRDRPHRDRLGLGVVLGVLGGGPGAARPFVAIEAKLANSR